MRSKSAVRGAPVIARLILTVALVTACTAKDLASPPPVTPVGVIAGRVLHAATNAPLAGAFVAAQSPPPAFVVEYLRDTTDADGAFRMSGAAPGSYIVTVVLAGFVSGQTNVVVTSGDTARRDILLQPVAHAVRVR